MILAAHSRADFKALPTKSPPQINANIGPAASHLRAIELLSSLGIANPRTRISLLKIHPPQRQALRPVHRSTAAHRATAIAARPCWCQATDKALAEGTLEQHGLHASKRISAPTPAENKPTPALPKARSSSKPETLRKFLEQKLPSHSAPSSPACFAAARRCSRLALQRQAETAAHPPAGPLPPRGKKIDVHRFPADTTQGRDLNSVGFALYIKGETVSNSDAESLCIAQLIAQLIRSWVRSNPPR